MRSLLTLPLASLFWSEAAYAFLGPILSSQRNLPLAFLPDTATTSLPFQQHIAGGFGRTVVYSTSDATPELKRVDPEQEGVAIPFIDATGSSFIECYADSVAVIDNVEYTIGVPCDYAVALCYYDENEQLVPVELDDELMDDIFPIAESIVTEEFGEELVLQRTPQTLTLVGELDDDDDDEEFEEDDDVSAEDDEEDEEEVEVLLSFEHRGQEFNLVRLLDPILLVGKIDPTDGEKRILLTAEESDKVMPALEEMFLEYHDDPDDILP